MRGERFLSVTCRFESNPVGCRPVRHSSIVSESNPIVHVSKKYLGHPGDKFKNVIFNVFFLQIGIFSNLGQNGVHNLIPPLDSDIRQGVHQTPEAE